MTQQNRRPEEALWFRKSRRSVSAKYRQEIIDALPFDLTKKQADVILHVIFDTITVSLLKRESVWIAGLGKLKLVRGCARRVLIKKGLKGGRGLLSAGEIHDIPAKHRVKFVPTESILLELNKKEKDGNTSTRD